MSLASLILLVAMLLSSSVLAFPPAPHHVFYGMVRDEMGNPLNLQTANVMLESPAGSAVEAVLAPGLEAGVNYRLAVPMDAGSSSDIYRNTALQSNMPFRLRVRIGQTIYLPIEMSGDFRALGAPAKRTRLDLTLGEDSNGNGIPDAWERAQIEASGGKLSAIDPNEDSDNDGLSNLQEYLAGTIAFDLNDGFSLKMVEVNAGVMAMEFMAIRGRTYTLFGSSNLSHWELVSFRLSRDEASQPDRQSYQAAETKLLRISVSPSAGQSGPSLFKLRVE